MTSLAQIRSSLDGAVPSAIATCSADGTPNVSYVSDVHYVDANHVALSYQFFNKTRANVLENPIAEALVIDPANGCQHSLALQYLRTETAGPVFEAMRVKLAGIAAHTGMEGVFHLRGSDVYRVLSVTALQEDAAPTADPARSLWPRLRPFSARLVGCDHLEDLLDRCFEGLQDDLGISHAMIFMADAPGRRLYLIGSQGYDVSGIGAEIPMGEGLVGLAAAEQTPIRLTHPAEGFRYGSAVRANLARSAAGEPPPRAIPLPGLPAPGSQLAVPVVAGGRTLAVVYVESETDGAFGFETEDLLCVVANQLALALGALGREREARAAPNAGPPVAEGMGGRPMRIRYYPQDSSVFVDDDYLIKGVAGAILWKLLSVHADSGRVDFSNRELRLDPDIQLPGQSENLEARLVLLKRRLEDRCREISIVPVARGKFRLQLGRPLDLERAAARSERAQG